MAIFKQEKTGIELLKSRGLTCGKLKSMANNQMRDAKKDLKDARKFRNFGFNEQASLQENISRAQEKSANSLNKLRKKLCPLR